MPKIHILGQEDVDVAPGTNLLTFLQERGYDTKLPASCGGAGQCSTCACRVLSGVGEPNSSEMDILSDEERADHWRLSCQVEVQEDVEIVVPGFEPPESLDIEADTLQQVLDYAATNFALREVRSSKRVSSKRLRDLALRSSTIVSGAADPAEFELLADVFNYAVTVPEPRQQLEREFELDEAQLGKLLRAFRDRVPEPEEEILMYPYYLYVIASIGFFLLVALSGYALLVDAPLEEPATPSFTPNPEKAPWYFLGIQELLAISPNLGGPFTSVAVGGVVVPTIFVLFLLALPYIEPALEFWRDDKSAPPGPRMRDRPVTTSLFFGVMGALIVLIIIGVYFRGPGWEWVTPWS